MDVRTIISDAFKFLDNPTVKTVVNAGLSGMGAAVGGYVNLGLVAGKQAIALLNAFRDGQIDEAELKRQWDAMVDEGAILDAATAAEAAKREKPIQTA